MTDQSIEDASRNSIIEDAKAAGFKVKTGCIYNPDYVEYEPDITELLTEFAKLREARQSSQSDPVGYFVFVSENHHDVCMVDSEKADHYKAQNLRMLPLVLAAPQQVSQSEPVGELSMDYQGFGSYKQMKQMPEGYHKLYAAPQQAIPSGYALVPHRLTKAMDRVLSEDDWQWEDLLAAANAITEEEYQAISTASPTAPIERDK
jgi:hypothetical protein